MRVTRLVAIAEGESRFTEFDIPLESKKLLEFTIRASDGFVSPNVSVVELPEGIDAGWHGSTARRLVIILSGVVEVETGDGEKRHFRPGAVFLDDDVAGRHQTRVVEGPVRAVFIPFSSDFVVDTWKATS
jgi:hypothetical protein